MFRRQPAQMPRLDEAAMTELVEQLADASCFDDEQAGWHDFGDGYRNCPTSTFTDDDADGM